MSTPGRSKGQARGAPRAASPVSRLRQAIGASPAAALRWLRRVALAALLLVLATAGGFAAYAVLLLPDLSPWHTDVLPGEFDADRHAALDFAGYQALEAGLFAQYEAWRQRHAAPARGTRFDPQGAAARLSGGAPYNRSFRLEVGGAGARGSALLVHGLTDAPYAMRALAETLHARGIEVTVLRLPGHGTLPSMMTRMQLADWQAAVRLAARDAAARRPAGAPFYLGGYSTGGALVLSLALAALDDPTLPQATRLLLFAPALRIAPTAGLANLLDLAAVLPVARLQKVKWQDLGPEYDPYKFNSFPVNATRQIYAATQLVQRQLARAAERGRLAALPPVIAWQSLVDATLGAAPLADLLFARLPDARHELVLFDVNRHRSLEAVADPAPRQWREALQARPRPWRLTVVGNESADTLAVAAQGPAAAPALPVPLRWPPDVISLSHVALPFRPDDPVYGVLPGSGAHGLPSLGALALRGEEGALQFPLGALTRLRSNPFWPLVQAQVEALVEADLAPR